MSKVHSTVNSTVRILKPSENPKLRKIQVSSCV